jgi:hypothetical protein
MRWTGLVACVGEKRNAYGVSVGKAEEKRPLGMLIHGRENNIKLDRKRCRMDWINVAMAGTIGEFL